MKFVSSATHDMVILAAAAWVAGCAQQPPPERIDPAAWKSPHVTAVGHPTSIPVLKGPPPLVYRMRDAGIIRVMDDKTGAQMARVDMEAGQMVAVTARGVMVEGKYLSYPLPKDHSYTIYVDIGIPQSAPAGDTKDKK